MFGLYALFPKCLCTVYNLVAVLNALLNLWEVVSAFTVIDIELASIIKFTVYEFQHMVIPHQQP